MQNFNNGEEIVNCSNRDYILKLSQNMVLKLAYHDTSHELRDVLGRWAKSAGNFPHKKVVTNFAKNIKEHLVGASKNIYKHLVKTANNIFKNKHSRYVLTEYSHYNRHIQELQHKLRRKLQLNLKEKIIVSKVHKIIDKAGDFPEKITTYRGIQFPENVHNKLLKRFKKHKYYISRGITSSSLSKDVAHYFAHPSRTGELNNKGMLLRMKLKNGVSPVWDASEILSKHGTKFKINKIIKNTNPENGFTHIIDLEQV